MVKSDENCPLEQLINCRYVPGRHEKSKPTLAPGRGAGLVVEVDFFV
jgi:hypothetical protein